MNSAFSYRIDPYGEHGWIAQLEAAKDPVATALFVNKVADALRKQSGICDSVAGVDSVVIKIDPQEISLESSRDIFEDALTHAPQTTQKARKRIDMPVCYGGAFGPDLAALAQIKKLTPQELIDAHAGGVYRVLAVGFAPGFAYLGPLDERLAAPRLDTPREHVPAGSVGVAGALTGVYPIGSPGGWRIIGRTPTILFDPDSPDPFTCRPGDEVRFFPVDETVFQKIENHR
ncbi:5-oxoprolinase subunit PxpB [Hyphococcus sp.]|uniref:5-oxoprolinase subunit PxpB n=1 Tax=Hyphococcus sp. TaxID=2038636 RepID=UPI003CCB77C3